MNGSYDMFEYYRASAAVIRDQAQSVRTGTRNLDLLLTAVAAEHQGAISAVEGDLAEPIAYGPREVQNTADPVLRHVAWAACQLEVFADAVEAHDSTSTQPSSVARLNEQYRTAQANLFGVPAPTYPPDVTPEQRAQTGAETSAARAQASTALMAQLQLSYAQLEQNLDEAASGVSWALFGDPTPDEVRAAWAAGNLPANAPLLWPEAGLTYDDLPGLPADVDSMTDEELAAYVVAHPEMDPTLRDRILQTRPTAVALVFEGSRPGDATAFVDYMVASQVNGQCSTAGGGVVIGPDGLPYAVTLPVPIPCPEGQTCVGDSLGTTGVGYTTVGTASGDIEIGDPTDDQGFITYVIAGGAGAPYGEYQSLGTNQEQLYEMVNEPGMTVSSGPGPYTPPPGTPDGPPGSGSTAGAAVDVGTALVEAASNAGQADSNQTYAYEVTYQVDDAGNRQAVIMLYQVQSDANGNIRVVQTPGVIDEDGNIVPAPPG